MEANEKSESEKSRMLSVRQREVRGLVVMAAGRGNKQETMSVPVKLPWQLSVRQVRCCHGEFNFIFHILTVYFCDD